MSSIETVLNRHLKTGKPELLTGFILQTWWFVYRKEEGPESGNGFRHLVGVVSEKITTFNAFFYVQIPELVLTKSLRSRTGLKIDKNSNSICFKKVKLCQVDWKYRIFPDED